MATTRVKRAIYQTSSLRRIIVPVYHTLHRRRNFRSDTYWEERYKKGGNSGPGSYGRLAEYKADFLNQFAQKHKLTSVIEFGCGDGNQLKLFKFKQYVGLDVSKTSITLCIGQFARDKKKSFYLYEPKYFQDNHRLFTADVALSLDVIYHLVEDEIFEKYMRDMFAAAKKYVIIYASNTNHNPWGQAQHVRHRKFTDWVARHEKGWKLVEHEKNDFTFTANAVDESFADFYVYQRVSRPTRSAK